MYNIAVILAGGIGNRLGAKLPKQLLKVKNKTIIEYSIDAFEYNNNIDEIVIVINEHYIKEISDIVLQNKYKKVTKVLVGGSERSDSSLTAINFFSNCNTEETNLIFHDSVRPLVSQTIINNVIGALENNKAVNVGVKCTDTIMKLNSDNLIEEIPAREFLYKTQTPQAFRYSLIKDSYKKAKEDKNFKATDDCGVVLKYNTNERIYVVSGEETNIKITFKNDLQIMELLLKDIVL